MSNLQQTSNYFYYSLDGVVGWILEEQVDSLIGGYTAGMGSNEAKRQ